MKHKLYNRLLSLALALGLVAGMLPGMTFAGAAEPNARSTTAPEVSFNLPVTLRGTDGTQLYAGKDIRISIENGNTVDPDDIVTSENIGTLTANEKAYNYQNAAVGFNGAAINSLQAGEIRTSSSDENGEIHWGSHTWRSVTRTITHYVGVWYGNKPSSESASNVVAYKTYTETYTFTQTYYAFRGWKDDPGSESAHTFSSASSQTDRQNVYFMYEPQGGTVTPDQSLSKRKFVEENEDGTYDLTLTVSGAAGSITNPQKLDVVFIVDKSGSMAWDMNHNDSSWEYQDPDADDTPRLTAVKNAISQIASELDSSETIDARYSLVSFSGEDDGERRNDATVNQTWTDNLSIFKSQLNRISSGGGTNYEAGLYSANQELLDSTRQGAMTAVIFLSDGEPTFYYNDNGYTSGSGSSYSQQAMDDAKAEAAKMAVDFFYAIGVGDSYNEPSYPWEDGEYSDTKMPEYMQDLVSGATQAKSTQFFDGNNSDALNNIFDQIGGDITSILCTDVTVTDTLSPNVEIVPGEDGTVNESDLKITVRNRQTGEEITSGYGSLTIDDVITITATYANGNITLDFPDDYQLNANYTFEVTAKIRATETAYNTYRESGYDFTGGEDTGSASAGKLGMRTNDLATVEYTYNGQTQTETYEVPVIQLHPGTLQITKQITGSLIEDEITALKETLQFKVTLDGKEETYSLNQFEQDNGIYTLEIKGLSPNTQYSVTESGAEVPGYILAQTPTGGTATGTVTKGGTATVAFTNNYKVATRDISVTKVWEGSETNPDSVTVWLYADGKKTDKFVTLNDTNEWTDSFNGLDIYNTAGEVIDYTVQEETVDGYTGVVTGDMTAGFTITNTRDTGSLTIKKTVEGLDDAALDELKNKLTFTVTGPDGYSEEIAFNATGWEQDGNTYTYTLENVPTGTYTVTETGYDTLEKYSWVEKDSTATANADVTKGATATAALTNVYIGKDGTLNINKVVTGFANNGKPVFDFKLTATDGTVYYYHVDMTGTGANQEKLVASVTLPVGEYTIEELSNQNYTLKSVAGADNKGDGTYKVTIKPQGTTTVTFTNDPKNTNIPTDGSATKNTVASVSEGVITWKQEPDEYGKDPNHNNINPNDEPAE